MTAQDRFYCIVNIPSFRTLFSLCFKNKMLVIRLELRKMLGRIANGEDPNQTASYQTAQKQLKQFDLGLHCLSRHFSSV